MVGLIDTHCHLTSEEFASDLASVLMAAQIAGIEKIVVPGVDLESSRKAVELAQKFPQVFAAVGVQPENCHAYSNDQLIQFEKLALQEKVVAIGEIGLDFHYHPEDGDLQKNVMQEMLMLALRINKPVIVHSRDAMEAVLRILTAWTAEIRHLSMNRLAKAPGVIHAFEGDLAQSAEAICLNFALGVGGPLTYKSAVTKRIVFEEVGLEHLVIETDSPYLPPHPFRGERNEPAHIKEIAQKLSELVSQPLEVVAGITTMNANLIFGWKA